MIKKINLFLEYRLFESSLNESMLYYTREFKDSLDKVKSRSKIADDLISVERTDVKPDMTFIGMSDREGFFSFSQIKKVIDSLKKVDDSLSEETIKEIENGTLSKKDVDYLYYNNPFNLKDKVRGEAKIAKLINQIFPNKYTNKEVEEFISLFKSLNKKSESQFELVDGKDIVKWYSVDNYYEEIGDLGGSCMRHNRCSDYFGIYVDNPDVCKLLILKKEDKLIGRALIWQLDLHIGSSTYMDRIYTIDDATRVLFEEYADNKGWLRRAKSGYTSFTNFKLGDDIYNARRITVKLENYKYEKYPYMDTFRKLNVDKGILINNEDPESEHYILTNTDGTYDDTSGNWSNYYDCFIPENESTWSEYLDSYIWSSDSIHVDIGRRRYRGWYPDDYDSIVTDCIRNEYIHIEDSVWSDYYNGYIYQEDLVNTITDINYNLLNKENCYYTSEDLSQEDNSLVSISDLMCYDYLSENTNCDYIIGSILEYNVTKRKYYIESCEVEVYNTELGDFIEEDCLILDLEKNKKYTKTDRITYNLGLEESVKRDLISKLELKISELDSLISGKQTRLVFDQEDDDRFIKPKVKLLNSLKLRLSELEGWI
jgi:hypothetical protein